MRLLGSSSVITSPGLQPLLRAGAAQGEPTSAGLPCCALVPPSPSLRKTHHRVPGCRQRAASGHLLRAWMGHTTSPMSSGILGSLAQTHDTAWGYSGLPNTAFVLHPGGVLLGSQVLPGSRAEDTYLFGSPISISEEPAAAIPPLEGRTRFADQEAKCKISCTVNAKAGTVCFLQPNTPSLTHLALRYYNHSLGPQHTGLLLCTPLLQVMETGAGHAPATPRQNMLLGKEGLQQFGLQLPPGNSETRAEMLTCSLVITSCLVISTSSLSSTANAG